jgi:hypothetical protein
MDPEEQANLLKSANETLEKIQAQLAARNEAPNTTPATPPVGIVDGGSALTQRGFMSRQDLLAVRQELRKKTLPELLALFAMQAEKDGGIPFSAWANAGGYAVQHAIEMSGNPTLRKALDTTGATALIRQDLEPVLYELYVRMFPAWERFPKEPANGLVHAYNQITAFGAAQFMAELGTVTDDQNVYLRQTTNVAVVATRRGISLKSQFAVLQGGAGYNPEQLELTGGLRAIAHTMQKQIFSGTSTDSAGTTSNESGVYDVNGFDGLRYILRSSPGAENADVLAGSPDDMRAKIDMACAIVENLGGTISIIWGNPLDKHAFDIQQDKNVRYMAPENLVNVGVGVLTNAVNTVFGPLPFATVPGDSIGAYSPSSAFSAATTCADLYLLDEETISMPYLGTDGPTVLDIPIGISGQLTHLYIIFGMWGLAVKAPTFSTKVRIRRS